MTAFNLFLMIGALLLLAIIRYTLNKRLDALTDKKKKDFERKLSNDPKVQRTSYSG